MLSSSGSPNAAAEEKAVPFISYSPKEGFQLTAEAEKFLQSLPEETQIGVISIVGKYRTGKSYFINRVLLNKNQSKGGFSVGPTVNPCTKGLWLYNRPLSSDNPEYPDMKILLIDTEGFGGTDENINHDSRIFLFSLLLCSYFIYNSVGNIDENALNGLSLIINLAKDIQIKGGPGGKQEDPADFFPAFLWVVRDFSLKLLDKDGTSIHPKEYLEKALELQKGISEAIESKNKIRRLFKHFFKDRDCVTMVRPVESEDDIQKLDTLGEYSLRAEFRTQIQKLRSKIFRKVQPKILNGRTFSGKLLLELCKAYIKTINSGQVPNIEYAWNSVVTIESRKALQDTLDSMEKELEDFISSPTQDVKVKKQKMKETALLKFRKKALGSENELKDYVMQLEKDFDAKFRKIKEKKRTLLLNQYQAYCKPKIEEMESKLKMDGYSSYYDFEREFIKFKEDFEKNGPPGPSKDQYIKEVSEKLYSLAAEHISRRSQSILSLETNKLQHKVTLYENELTSKRQDWEREKSDFINRIRELEKENLHLTKTKSTEFVIPPEIEKRFEALKKEKSKLEEDAEANSLAWSKKESEYKSKISELTASLQQNFSNMQTQKSRDTEEKDRANKIQDQEIIALKREIELEKARGGNLEKAQVQSENKYQEVLILLKQKEEELKRESEKRAIELASEHRLLESQLSFFQKNQELFFSKFQNENLSQTSASMLSLNQMHQSMDDLKQKNNQLLEKLVALKRYKTIFMNCVSLQCLHCTETIPRARVFSHFSASCKDSSSAFVGAKESKNKPMPVIKDLAEGRQYIHPGYPSNERIDIRVEKQSMKTEEKYNNNYIEYEIVCLSHVNGNRWEWRVRRKFKEVRDLQNKIREFLHARSLPDGPLKGSFLDEEEEYVPMENRRILDMEGRRAKIESCLREMEKEDTIRESEIFKSFLTDKKQVDTMMSEAYEGSNTIRPTFLEEDLSTPESKSCRKPLLKEGFPIFTPQKVIENSYDKLDEDISINVEDDSEQKREIFLSQHLSSRQTRNNPQQANYGAFSNETLVNLLAPSKIPAIKKQEELVNSKNFHNENKFKATYSNSAKSNKTESKYYKPQSDTEESVERELRSLIGLKEDFSTQIDTPNGSVHQNFSQKYSPNSHQQFTASIREMHPEYSRFAKGDNIDRNDSNLRAVLSKVGYYQANQPKDRRRSGSFSLRNSGPEESKTIIEFKSFTNQLERKKFIGQNYN